MPNSKLRSSCVASRLLFVLLLSLAPLLWAKPKLHSAFLRFGRSPRLPAHNWAYFSYKIQNPDTVVAQLRLVLRAQARGSAVFEKRLSIGPESYLNGRELVTVAPTETYSLEVFHNDERILREKIECRSTDPQEYCQIFFLDDNVDFSGGSNVARNGLIKIKVAQTRLGSSRAPHHWAGYGSCNILALAQPDYTQLSAIQYAAISEYVHRGGTLVFIDPKGAVAAAATPLGDIMPVHPLRVRQIEALPEIDAWGKNWFAQNNAIADAKRREFALREGFAFLESSPRGSGVTSLATPAFPIFRWRRVGLGRVGICAFDPCSDLAFQSACLAPVWEHLISWGAERPFIFADRANNTLLPLLLARLTGFEIPSVKTISFLLVGYIVILILVLVPGYRYRRNVQAWLTATALGVLVTIGFFVAAHKRNSTSATKSVSLVSMTTSSGRRSSGQAALSFFSHRDCRPDFREKDDANLLRNLPPPTRGKSKRSGDAPLLVRRDGDQLMAPAMHIQALKPRSMAMVYTRPPLALPEAPVLRVSDGGLSLSASKLPEWVAPPNSKSFVVLPSGLVPVSRSGNVLGALQTNRSGIQLDPFMNLLEDYLQSGAFPSLSLVHLQPWTAQTPSLSLDCGDFQPHGYDIHFTPLGLEIVDQSIAIPRELISIKARGSTARMIRLHHEGVEQYLRKSEDFLEYVLVLPAWLGGVKVEELDVEFDFANPGSNIRTEIAIVPMIPKPKNVNLVQSNLQAWRKGFPQTEVRGIHSIFRNIPPHLLSPSTNSYRLFVRLSQKTMVRGTGNAERANSWSINNFRATARGTFVNSDTRRFLP